MYFDTSSRLTGAFLFKVAEYFLLLAVSSIRPPHGMRMKCPSKKTTKLLAYASMKLSYHLRFGSACRQAVSISNRSFGTSLCWDFPAVRTFQNSPMSSAPETWAAIPMTAMRSSGRSFRSLPCCYQVVEQAERKSSDRSLRRESSETQVFAQCLVARNARTKAYRRRIVWAELRRANNTDSLVPLSLL